MCGFVMFSCSEELSQGEQRVETSEVSTEGTSLLVANAFLNQLKRHLILGLFLVLLILIIMVVVICRMKVELFLKW